MRARYRCRLIASVEPLSRSRSLYEALKERRGYVARKTVLLIDDEQGFLEALADALEFEGYRVLKASIGEDALRILAREKVHLATVDMMMPQGKSLEGKISSHQTGILLCETITRDYPSVALFCLSAIPFVLAQVVASCNLGCV